MAKTFVRSSDISHYLWCPYTLELSRRGVAPVAKEIFTQGAAVHERISDKVYAGTVVGEQKLAWGDHSFFLF